MGDRENKQLESAKHRRTIRTYQILLVVLVLINLAIGYVWGKTSHTFEAHVAEHMKKYPFIDPARNFIPQEDFITNIQPLREQLNNLVAQSGKTVSLYLEMLNTGANIQINPNLGIFPASLAKLPLGLAVVKKVEDGIWSWDNELVLSEQDVDRNSGPLYQNPVGTVFTIEELTKALLIESDNTAYKILLRNMNTQELTNIVNELGLNELFREEGRISAKEYTRMLRSLYTSSYLKRENSNKILDWITQSPFNEYLASGLPAGTKFAHKIGENQQFNTYSDAGIVYIGNRAYLIAVMIEEKDSPDEKQKATEFMKLVSQKAYEYVSSQ